MKTINEDYNKFNIPKDLFFEDDDTGFFYGNYVQISCKVDEESICISDVSLLLTMFNGSFREFFVLIMLFNNIHLFSAEDVYNVISNLYSTKNKRPNNYEEMVNIFLNSNKNEFITRFVSSFIADTIDNYMRMPEEELEEKMVNYEIMGDPLRFSNGYELLYNFYMKTILYLLIDKRDKSTLKLFDNTLLPVNDLCAYDRLPIEDFSRKFNCKVDVSKENNEITQITMFRLFLDFVVTLHNSLKELMEPLRPGVGQFNRLTRCPVIIDIINKTGFDVKDDGPKRIEKCIELLLGYKYNKPRKAIFSVIKTAEPFFINTQLGYYNEKNNNDIIGD